MRKLACTLLVGLSACATTPLPHPTPAQVGWAQQSWPDSGPSELEKGRAIYLGRCGSCHHPHHPAEYPRAEWPQLVEKMTKRAKVDPTQAQLILRYLQSTAEP